MTEDALVKALTRRLQMVSVQATHDYLLEHGAVPDGELVAATTRIAMQRVTGEAIARECLRQMEWARHSATFDVDKMTDEEWRAMKGPPLSLAPEEWTP